ncbi:MAG: hypothetical protein JWO64_2314 [Hyphomicrobiales bacterium]|nr:hypothetical protein [Hyphomicrobiales bacterium]
MDDLASERRIFSARLTPHRSLSRSNFRLLLIVVGAAGLFTALPFVILGAWPVAGFMGLDVALIYFAFRANFRDARAYEDVTLTPLELHLAKVSAKGARADWRFNPSWVRLEREEDEEFGLQRLSVASRGASIEIAHYLGPDDKARFATELSRALAEARRGPRYN